MTTIEDARRDWREVKMFVHRNHLAILLAIMIVFQGLTWIETKNVRDEILRWGCGSSSFPCRVIVTSR